MLTHTGITLDSVIDALAERIATKIGAENQAGTSGPGKRLLTTEEAAEYLGRTKEAMQHLAISGKLPTVRSDRRVFFDIHDLERWISQNKEAGLN